MSTRLLAKLRKRGIEVGRVGGQLQVVAPEDVLTAAAVAFLREHRDVLLAELSAPPAPPARGWAPATVSAAVEARARVLRGAGLSVVEAELQAAEEILRLDGVQAHESAWCDLHRCRQRKLPCSEVYRCPACVPGSFARRPTEAV